MNRRMSAVIGCLLAATSWLSCSISSAQPSSDRAPQLRLRTTGVKASLRGLCAVDGQVAWAGGSQGTLIKTTDGGATWQAVVVKGYEEAEFRDIHAWSKDEACVMVAGQPAHMLRTHDGGESWGVVFKDPRADAFFDSLEFYADGKRGLLFGDPIEGRISLFATDDGGRRWSTVDAPRAQQGEAGFAASGTCIAVHGQRAWIGLGGAVANGRARVLVSKDRGNGWSAVETPLPCGQSSGIFSILFWNDDQGVAVGGDYQKPDVDQNNIILSQDGGRSWSQPNKRPTGYRSAVALVSTNPVVLIATGPNGTDVSRDAGKSWQRLSEHGFHAVTVSGGRIWLVGGEGRAATMPVASVKK